MKKYSKYFVIAFMVTIMALFTGCGNGNGGNEWKALYADYVRSNWPAYEYAFWGYELAKIDNNDIPELIMIPTSSGYTSFMSGDTMSYTEGVMILTIDEDGNVIANRLCGEDTLIYEEQSGKFIATELLSDGVYDDEVVYKGVLEDHRIAEIEIGNTSIYDGYYEWESKSMSKEDYESKKYNSLGASQQEIKINHDHDRNMDKLMSELQN